jgi:hypothetical protein
LKYGISFTVISADLNERYERRNMPYQSEAEWQRAEEAADARRHRRQQAELFDEFNQTTPEEREVTAFYAYQRQLCACGCTLGMHDFPPTTECKTTGCGCSQFRMTTVELPVKPVGSERGAGEEAA